MILVGIISTLSPLASSMVAPGIGATMKEFHESSHILGSFMITIFVLGYAIGPLFLGPLSELYGRYPVTIISTWIFVAWIMGSALAPSMTSLIIMRLLAGIGGAGVMTIGPAIVADMYPVEKRASSTALIVMAQSVGPALGPICGGFISSGLSWRWVSFGTCTQ
jgi:multidrug resistance protein